MHRKHPLLAEVIRLAYKLALGKGKNSREARDDAITRAKYFSDVATMPQAEVEGIVDEVLDLSK